MYHISFMQSSIDEWLFLCLASVDNAAINVGCLYLFKMVISFPSDKFLEVELVNHMVGFFLIF